MKHCTFQLYARGVWLDIARLELIGLPEGGIATACLLGYAVEWAAEHNGARDAHALSAGFPVAFDLSRLRTWPAFLVDLLPQGYGREELLRVLGLPERAGGSVEWQLLLAGAGNPIGHLRVREAYDWLQAQMAGQPQQGFTQEQVSGRVEPLLEYLSGHGLFVAGSSGVQGEWPKLLMTRARDGLWYLDHVLPDSEAVGHCIVKFARGADPSLAEILRHEPVYMRIAKHLGLRVHGLPWLVDRTLFIPRFDRVVNAEGVMRIAQESLASVCGIAAFGAALPHDTACAQLVALCTDPFADILEFLRRDVANLALGNKDNHPRNTALARSFDGRVTLTPLYDFVPMLRHPDGIARRCKWQDEGSNGPRWAEVIRRLAATHGLPEIALREGLAALEQPLREIAKNGREFGMEPEMLSLLQPALITQADALAELKTGGRPHGS